MGITNNSSQLAGNRPVKFYQVKSDGYKRIHSEIITETLVSLTINGEVWISFMCTPVHLEALAIGFVYNEGLIDSVDEVAAVRLCPTGDNVDLWLNHRVDKPALWQRTSGCSGGVTSVQITPVPATKRQSKAMNLPNNKILTQAQITNLVTALFESQDLYRKSGGVHTSALSDGRTILLVAEDIGRHNTLDKIAGLCLLEGINPHQRILLTTGRISSEMMLKSARLGADVIISRTSPSSLSIELAETLGITTIGYARRDRFNVYSHPERINLPEEDR